MKNMRKTVFLIFGLAIGASHLLARPPADTHTHQLLEGSYDEGPNLEPNSNTDYHEISKTLSSIKNTTSFTETVQILKNAVNLLRFRVQCDQEVADMYDCGTSNTHVLTQLLELIGSEIDQFQFLVADLGENSNFIPPQTASIVGQLQHILNKMIRWGFLDSQEYKFKKLNLPHEASKNTWIRPIDAADPLPIPGDESPEKTKKARFFP
jgi:hypothetical protein